MLIMDRVLEFTSVKIALSALLVDAVGPQFSMSQRFFSILALVDAGKC
jgi:hypothetical protein